MLDGTMGRLTLRLREARLAAGLTQAELAAQSGVPQGTISRLESGTWRSFNLDHVEALADALRISALDLLHGHASPHGRRRRPG